MAAKASKAKETDWAAETEQRLLDAALPLAPEIGWNRTLIVRAGREIGLSLGETELLIPNGARDLAALLSRRHDALGMAAQFESEVTLVHVVEQIIYPGDWMYPPLAMSDFAAEKRDEVLQKMQALVHEPKAKVNYVVRVGRAWQEVSELAKESNADVLIIATHGYTGLKHVLLGSVAEKIIRHAPCPVLTVRPDERDFL